MIRRCLLGILWLMLLGVTFRVSNTVVGATFEPSAKTADAQFLVKPYLQLGDASTSKSGYEIALLWHANNVATNWTVEYQATPEASWQLTPAPTMRLVSPISVAPHRVFRAALNKLLPGKAFSYRVRKGSDTVFTAKAHAPKSAGQSYRFVSFGDCGAGTVQQKLIAYQTFLAQPDFVMITGDIVYSRGRISEYRKNFWPAYNADHASPLLGAPLLRSTLFVAAPGNHDIDTSDLGKYPDGLAYFLYWDQPRNGPLKPDGTSLVPHLIGPAANQKAFLEAAGDAYPRMASFSFEYGNAHWTVLDSNRYVDWANPELWEWLERDLARAQDCTWRFVAFHHPGFNSSKAHFDDQQMRILAKVFEVGRVDVVFSGHVHNYQRTYPLQFTAEKDKHGKPIREHNKVPGRWTLDKAFDGRSHTRPQGVIYLVTGAGGNTLYNPEQQDNPRSWQSFTCRFISKVHSFTIADVNATTLTVRQVSAKGTELDRFIVTK